ncbi:uncharacterized protein LOC107632628 [Arachis ipaensis]|uniref:uncharacterized protein LOC107632628 n=1 Tax=Arachis ipaensis TaxID=130454 RepID=UPI0007AF53BC|nr:uncharacterized protein LOC107632628 [Arachis ipaensis]
MQEEYSALMHNSTWQLVPQPPPHTAPVIGSKWVFWIKKHPDGTIQKYKARLVAKGFHQREEVNYDQVFSPVIRPPTVWVMLSLALSKGWPIRHFDFNNAFLNGDLQETLKETLNRLGFTNTKSDTSLLTRFSHSSVIYVLVYVDDILVTGSSQVEIYDLIVQLNAVFALKDLGKMSYFLGIEAMKFNDSDILICQTKYIKDLLTKAGMRDAKAVPTPMVSNLKLSAHGEDVHHNLALYRSIVDGLQYATITRPEITFAVNKVSQFMHTPLKSHWKAVKRILRYLAGTIDYGLMLQRTNECQIYGFSDSDWDSDIDDRKSTSGFCVFLGPNLVSWSSRKQKCSLKKLHRGRVSRASCRLD